MNKLIIIAAPKTASTSLMMDLQKITGIQCKQQFRPPFKKGIASGVDSLLIRSSNLMHSLSGSNPALSRNITPFKHSYPALEYPYLRLLHSDICNFNDLSNDIFNSYFPYMIHKQHLPPTKDNIRLISKNFKVIFLYNSPEEIVESYKRVKSKLINEIFFQNEDNPTESIKKELQKFNSGWIRNTPKSNVFTKEELICKTSIVVNKCLELLGESQKSVEQGFELSKKRYTRG